MAAVGLAAVAEICMRSQIARERATRLTQFSGEFGGLGQKSFNNSPSPWSKEFEDCFAALIAQFNAALRLAQTVRRRAVYI